MSDRRHEITRDDLIPMERYEQERKARRRAIVAVKKRRRLDVGPLCSFHFENYETMLAQVHEMLFIEKGGEAQIPDELAAYNPLVPKGRELVVTIMFEIPDAERRRAVLSTLGGVEDTAFIEVAGETVTGVPEEDVDRTTADGKASSVQFVHFPFTDAQVDAFRSAGARVVVGLSHPNYNHMTVLSEDVRAALAEDFD